MKRILFTLVLMFGVFAVMAQDAEKKEVEKKNGPGITFEETMYDYGEIILNGDGVHKFEFTNTGNEPLILTKPRSSCGCTVPSWPKEPILPGETSEIKVTYNTHKAGGFNKTVTIYSNAKTVLLRIKGKVIPKPTEAMPTKPTSKGAAPVNEKK